MGDIDEIGHSDMAEMDSSTIYTSTSGSYTHTGDIPLGTSSTAGDSHFYDSEGSVVDPVEEIVEEEITEETQKEIDKIGTPGKRNIDDILGAFKVVKSTVKKAPLEELDDSSWLHTVMEGEPPRSTGAAPDEVSPPEATSESTDS